MSTKKTPLTIGKLAKAAKVNIETIRYYQRQGLLIEPVKPLNGFRHYPLSDIDKIRFIKRAQHIGFSLKEIKQLLLLGEQQCHDIQALATEKHDEINEKIAALQTISTVLKDLINSCQNMQNPNSCGFIETLSLQGFLDN
jgi:MerR family transcriptional regulator, mercuric resistance operon regulatory protein